MSSRVFLQNSYMAEVVHERDAEAYALSMEIEYSEAPTLLTLKVRCAIITSNN